MPLCAEHEADLELCSSVYPELFACLHASGALELTLPLSSHAGKCTLHLLLPPTGGSPCPSLSHVRGWLDEGALTAALAAAAAAGGTPLELCMLAAEQVASVQPPCPICLQAISGDALQGPCQHPCHRHCGARHLHALIEARRASAEHAAAKAVAAAASAAAQGRARVAEGAAAFAQAALEACQGRLAELRARVEAAAAGGSGSGSGSAPKRALPPSKARRFEAAEEAAAAEALPLPVQLERAQAEAEVLRAEAAAAQARLVAVRRSSGEEGASSGAAAAASENEAEAALEEHLAVAQDMPLPCPVCRVPLPHLPPFYPAWARSQRHLLPPAQGAPAAAAPALPEEAPPPLPAALARDMAQLEASFRALWAKQEARGGIIEARRWCA